MDAAWIGVIGTLSGVIVTGTIALVSKYLELRAESRKHRRETRIEKLELLFVDLVSFANFAMEQSAAILACDVAGDPNSLINTVASVPTAIHFRSVDLITRLGLYAPELKPSLVLVATEVGNLIDLANKFVKAPPDEENHLRQISIEEISKATADISTKSLVLQSELGDKITTLIRER